MATEIITLSDLKAFKQDLLQDIKAILNDAKDKGPSAKNKEEVIWLKSNDVQRLLGISASTLQTLRLNGTIPYTKVGGVLFYDKRDIINVMVNNKRNG